VVLRELAAAVRGRRVSARELVGLSLERVRQLDQNIGAVVALRAEEALAEAADLDERVAKGEDLGPLAGIPCLIKEIEDLEGLPTTHGSLLFRDAPPAVHDGTICARLRAAGAIPIGKSNTPELATEGFTANSVFGATRNPWAHGWSPGGSSGGSAAAVAAGIVPIGTATDTGGSIRIPAALCGLVGIKPTNGMIASDPGYCWPDLTTAGPLAPAVDDLRVLLEAEQARPGFPSLGDQVPGGWPDRALAAPRFGLPHPLADVVEAAFTRATAHFEGVLGLEIEPAAAEGVVTGGDPDSDWGIRAAPELVVWLGRERAAGSLDQLHPATRGFVEMGLAITIDEYLAVRERARGYARDLDRALGENGVVITPTVTLDGWLPEGPVPGSSEPAPPLDAYNTNVQNQTGHPAISLPAGRLPNGVPFGIQLTAPRFRDRMLLEVANAWEEAHPWPVVAEGHDPFTL
jgi:Asp-tRNA(Asn)/Glu-tRNA(Gln) amidotransferase A subunit family amidase